MQEFVFFRPGSLRELKENLALPGAQILAGGTDIIPGMRRNGFLALKLVDATGVKGLDSIEEKGDKVVLGALVTHQVIAESPLIKRTTPALQEAAETIGSVQTRSRGTLGGNIANASPAGDTIPPLLVYDAEVLLQSLAGERILPLDQFVLGPGKTALKPGEFIHSVTVTPLKGNWGSHFIKVVKRSGMAISVVNAASGVVLNRSGLITDVRLALGAVGPVVIRCRETEKFLIGKKPDPAIFQEASDKSRAEISPIQDIRSTENYRAHAAGVIAGRVLEIAVGQAQRRRQ